MKRFLSNILATLLLLSCLTACGSGQMSAEQGAGVAKGDYNSGVSGNVQSSFNSSKSELSDVYDYEYSEDYDMPSSEDSGLSDVSDNVQGGTEINKDMLVYRGRVQVNTKEYAEAIEKLSELYEKYDCFIESSREYSNYRYSDDDTLMSYEATVRVNSADYEEFMNGASGLGVVRSKSSTVENMNVEYSDTVTALRIYEARMERYLKRLETELDNEVAMQLEREITSIQVTLQQLEARKRLIETDVAYSYVELAIDEVKAYTAQVTHDDPLHVRLWAEVVNTYYEFTEFSTNLLFAFVHMSPYIVILVIVYVILRKKFNFRFKNLFRRRKRVKEVEAAPEQADKPDFKPSSPVGRERHI